MIANDTDTREFMLKTSVNLCRIPQGFANLLVKLMMILLRDVINFEMKCPFKKGVYKFNNFQMSNIFIPSRPPTRKFNVTWEFQGFGQLNKSAKQMLHVFSFNVGVRDNSAT